MGTLRDKIKAIHDSGPRPLDVPEWACRIQIRPLTLREQGSLKAYVNDEIEATVRVVILGTCDESGAPLFTVEDRDWLKDRNGAVLTRIAEAILKQPTAEDLEKN